jgi:hypothetical protein
VRAEAYVLAAGSGARAKQFREGVDAHLEVRRYVDEMVDDGLH